jgi:very-short-patch-repair endonuclease
MTATRNGGPSDRRPPDSLSRLLKRQFLVISRQQAQSFGIGMSTVQYRIRPGGPWQRIFPGVYLTVSGTPTTDQLDMAALLYAGRPSMITGAAALRRYRIGAQPTGGAVDVLVSAANKVASRSYVRIHRTSRLPPTSFVEGEIDIVPPPRAVIDAALALASVSDLRALLADATLRRVCSVTQLERELGTSRLRNSTQVRAVLREVKTGTQSAPEGGLRDLIKRTDLPQPLYNARLYVGDKLIGRPDAWWPEAGLAVEVDSMTWHWPVDLWEQTMDRQSRLGAAGIRVLHFSPAQIRSEPGRVIALIKAAIENGTPVSGIRTKPFAS